MKRHANFRVQKIARELARDSRKNQTPAEIILWRRLRKEKIKKYKFLRQHPVFFNYYGNLRFFITDFCCYELRLIIEVDGSIHLNQLDYDQRRTELLETKNYHVLRFSNEAIINHTGQIVNEIKRVATEIEELKSPD